MEIKRKTTQETDFLMQASDEIDDKETLKQMIYVANSTYILIP